jgi:o-succinylbenzoate synthase
MAHTAVEVALLDAELLGEGKTFKDYFDVSQERIAASVVFGIPADSSIDTLLAQIAAKVTAGVRGIKCKISPTWALEPIAAVRKQFGDELSIIADANGSFAKEDFRTLRQLGELDVMIEQPLHRDDLAGHAKLVQQEGIRRICLDESVETVDAIERAIDLGAAHVLALKYQRFGLAQTVALQKRCTNAGIATRIGGMYSSALGKVIERLLAVDHEQSDITPFGMQFANGVDLAPAEQLDAMGTVPVVGRCVVDDALVQLFADSGNKADNIDSSITS